MLSSISGRHFAGHFVSPNTTTPLPPNPYGASLWYSMKDNSFPGGATKIVYDVSGSNYHLTTANVPTYFAADPKSLRFTGLASETLTLPVGALLMSGTNYNTFDMWVKFPSNPTVNTLLFSYKDVTTGDGYGFYLNTDGRVAIHSVTQFGTTIGTTTNPVSLNTWMLLSLLGGGAPGNNSYVYINGFPVGGTTLLASSFRKTQMRLVLGLDSFYNGLWSQFQFSYGSGGGMNKFNAERSYYGV